MTTDFKKRMERHYLETAIGLLGLTWIIEEEREAPDFIVSNAGDKFGLEVSSVFTGPTENGGSVMRREESDRHELIRLLQVEHEKEHPEPLIVKLVGDLAPANVAAVLPAIRSLKMDERPITLQEVVDIDQADAMLSVYVTKALRPEWYYVDDRVGFVDRYPTRSIADRIASKARKLNAYKAAVGIDDIRLLIVADRRMNSGKLVLVEPAMIDRRGFRRVYFLSYPESVQVL